jgi:hypothetical protein
MNIKQKVLHKYIKNNQKPVFEIKPKKGVDIRRESMINFKSRKGEARGKRNESRRRADARVI